MSQPPCAAPLRPQVLRILHDNVPNLNQYLQDERLAFRGMLPAATGEEQHAAGGGEANHDPFADMGRKVGSRQAHLAKTTLL